MYEQIEKHTIPTRGYALVFTGIAKGNYVNIASSLPVVTCAGTIENRRVASVCHTQVFGERFDQLVVSHLLSARGGDAAIVADLSAAVERPKLAAPRHRRGLYNQGRASTHKKNLRVKSSQKSRRHAILPPQSPYTAEDAYNRESDEE
ncbi:hypothetical protein [Paraburkholderia sp. BCC1885]|uniref:hypothetical protein n=1 Tax=Paraburkholderia sp. BCC1885 TaxID=2562669 RepID=UPI0016425412|nr:hypothetical protein [Paraburkholderia sp. BCC1885]